MYNKTDKIRTFSPVVLVHDYNKNTHYDDDEYFSEYIKQYKKRVEEMLLNNSQFWQRVKENTRQSGGNIFSFDTCNNNNKDTTSTLENSIYTHHDPKQPTLNSKIKRRRGNLPKATTALLKEWLACHKKHPYPTEDEKVALAKQTHLSLQQISNWFINARRRHLPNLLEGGDSTSKSAALHHHHHHRNNNNTQISDLLSSSTDTYTKEFKSRHRSKPAAICLNNANAKILVN